MTFPTIPTVAAGRVLWTTSLAPVGTHISPLLTSLTKNAGDLLIAGVIIYDGNSTNAEFSAWGGGFTEFGDFAGTATMGIGCAYKVSTGAETGTFTVTSADTSTNDSAFFLLSIPAANRGTAPEAGSFVTGTSAAADPGSFDPAGWGAEDTLWIAVAGSGETSTTGSFTGVASAPANYSDYVDSGISADVVGGVEGAVAFRQLNAASENVGTFSVDTSNARNAALVIAIRPTIDTTVTPGVVSLTLTAFAPTVTTGANQLVTPGTASLALATFAPMVLAPRLVTPPAASLTLATFAPTVTAGAGTVLTPGTAALSLTAFAPTVVATDHKLVTPGSVALTLATFAPVVTASDNIVITPDVVALNLATFAPTVSVGSGATVTPGTAALTLTGYAPYVGTAGGPVADGWSGGVWPINLRANVTGPSQSTWLPLRPPAPITEAEIVAKYTTLVGYAPTVYVTDDEADILALLGYI